jgi:hypothetical protein
MSGRVEVRGLEELKQYLASMPEHMNQLAIPLVRTATEGTAAAVRQAYPQKTGTLAKRVRTSYPASHLAIGLVSSQAPHSHIFEFGTQGRRTARGANRGRMPATPTTPAIAVRFRETLFTALVNMLRGAGFDVRL